MSVADFEKCLDPSSRLNRIVDGASRLEVQHRAKHTIATGTHLGSSSGKVFKIKKWSHEGKAEKRSYGDHETPNANDNVKQTSHSGA